MTDQKTTEQLIKERFDQLSPVLKKAIQSAEVEEHLRKLADQHKLHLDQWQLLENQVIMTMLGFQPAAELEENIKKEVHVDAETARALASDIALAVFDPIRNELEHTLQATEAREYGSTVPKKEGSADTDQKEEPQKPRVERTEAPAHYAPGSPSTTRKAVEGDPYREQIE